jgi:hypothetical protein
MVVPDFYSDGDCGSRAKNVDRALGWQFLLKQNITDGCSSLRSTRALRGAIGDKQWTIRARLFERQKPSSVCGAREYGRIRAEEIEACRGSNRMKAPRSISVQQD